MLCADLPPLPTLHVREQKLEAIAQRSHVRVHVLLELERLRNNFDSPVLNLGVLTSFEAQEEIARVLGIDAEIVNGSLGVGFCVGGQPSLCVRGSAKAYI